MKEDMLDAHFINSLFSMYYWHSQCQALTQVWRHTATLSNLQSGSSGGNSKLWPTHSIETRRREEKGSSFLQGPGQERLISKLRNMKAKT